MAEEEEVRLEVEAVRAVYGDDCLVIRDFPPHLIVHIAPRTADDSAQQFVEAILGIQASAQYPEMPPHVYIVESKGLDESRQTQFTTRIQNKAQELSLNLMLVALCEEAVEILSNMNHPDGNCPLCLFPLVGEEASGTSVPFMKLMSCYHCFHSECIIRWWNWLHEQNETNEIKSTYTVSLLGNHRGTHSNVNQHQGNCPICRKLFDAKDIEHVLNYPETDLSQLSTLGIDPDEDVKLFLKSDTENHRKQKFEALLKLQQENNGLIEPKKNIAILPGMYLPTAVTAPTASTDSSGEQCRNSAVEHTLDTNPSSSMNKATSSKQKNSNSRRSKFHSSRRQPNIQSSRKQWIRKEPDS